MCVLELTMEVPSQTTAQGIDNDSPSAKHRLPHFDVGVVASALLLVTLIGSCSSPLFVFG